MSSVITKKIKYNHSALSGCHFLVPEEAAFCELYGLSIEPCNGELCIIFLMTNLLDDIQHHFPRFAILGGSSNNPGARDMLNHVVEAKRFDGLFLCKNLR